MIPENPIDYLTSALKELKQEHAKKLRNQGMSYGSDKLQRKAENLILCYQEAIQLLQTKPKQSCARGHKTQKQIRIENLLKKARQLYPAGTKFTSPWHADDIVRNEAFYREDEGDIWVTGHCEERIIYGRTTRSPKRAWAEIRKG